MPIDEEIDEAEARRLLATIRPNGKINGRSTTSTALRIDEVLGACPGCGEEVAIGYSSLFRDLGVPDPTGELGRVVLHPQPWCLWFKSAPSAEWMIKELRKLAVVATNRQAKA